MVSSLAGVRSVHGRPFRSAIGDILCLTGDAALVVHTNWHLDDTDKICTANVRVLAPD